MIIDRKHWHICKICQMDISQITVNYSKRGKYKTDYFIQHLSDIHDLDINDYFGNGEVCPCGICNKKLQVKKRGADFFWRKYACGRNKGVLEWSIKAKKERLGKNNPMYNKRPWNKYLNKQNSDYGKLMSKKTKNRIVSKETREKQSESAKCRKKHGHTGFKHSEESKHKMRLATIERIKNGSFPQIDTLPSRKFESLLNRLDFDYIKEYHISLWSFDFYLPKHDILIEVDGDYFHSNPLIYTNGPITKTQKINKYRDDKKNLFCKENNLKLMRFWERDILGDEQCVLQKLLELKK